MHSVNLFLVLGTKCRLEDKLSVTDGILRAAILLPPAYEVRWEVMLSQMSVYSQGEGRGCALGKTGTISLPQDRTRGTPTPRQDKGWLPPRQDRGYCPVLPHHRPDTRAVHLLRSRKKTFLLFPVFTTRCRREDEFGRSLKNVQDRYKRVRLGESKAKFTRKINLIIDTYVSASFTNYSAT